ncbi:MAG: hypothetical protein AAF682_21040 [Planctomycetota bacterium]
MNRRPRPALVWGALAFLAAPLAGAVPVLQEPPSDALRLAVEAGPPTRFVGERVELRLRIEVDERFLREGLIQPFHRRLDLPLQLSAEWLGAAPAGEVETETGGAEAGRATLAVNDGVRTAAALGGFDDDGRTYAVYELRHELLASEPGELRLAAPELRFAFATRFRDDLLLGRVPEDRHDAAVSGDEVALRVQPLPPPPEAGVFSGVVATSLTLAADAAPTELAVGDSLRLTLTVRASGGLAALRPPDFHGEQGLAGWHPMGRIERPDADGRTFVYDLAATEPAPAGVPPIEVLYFDPTPPGTYRSAATVALPVRVSGGSPADGVTAGDAGEEVEGEPSGLRRPVVFALGGAAAAALVFLLVVRAAPRRA